MLKTKLALALALAFAGTVATAHPGGMGRGPGDCTMGGGPQSEACQAQMHERHEAMVRAADTDKDGTISKAEAEKTLPWLARHFDAVDANKDGKLTAAELDTSRTSGAIGGPHGAMMGAGGTPEARLARMHERHETQLNAADTDKDGTLSKVEAEKALPRLAAKFDAVDTDHDGKLTVAEWDAARAAGVLGGPGHRGHGPGHGGGPCAQQPAQAAPSAPKQ